MALPKILLVEDNENDIMLTLSALKENNLANDVQVLRDGEEALDYLFRRGKYKELLPGKPAVILLDLKMPKIDGLEVLQVIKSDKKLRTIPVVVLTSSNIESDLIKSYEFGANAYVVKPVDFQEFVRAIKELGVFWAILNEPPPR